MPKLIFFLFGVILQIAAQICGNYIRWAASELYALCLFFFHSGNFVWDNIRMLQVGRL